MYEYPFFYIGGAQLDIHIKQWEAGSCFPKEVVPRIYYQQQDYWIKQNNINTL